MKNSRPGLDSEGALTLPQRWNRFWFAPVEAHLLHRIRVLAGLLMLAWLLNFAGHHHALFSLQGWLDKEAYQEISRKQADDPNGFQTPAPIGWSIFYLPGVDADAALFDGFYWLAVATVLFFTLGIAPRLTGILTWVVVVSIIANPAITYDADYLLGILAFYLMIAYALLGLWSGPPDWRERLFGPWSASVFYAWTTRHKADILTPQSYAANFVLRLLQIHFAVIVASSALSVLQFSDWWAGVAYWYSVHPPFQTTLESYNRERGTTALVTLTTLSLVQYLALAWQITFPAFAWRRGRCRILLVGGGVLAWIGFFGIRGLPLFGPFYFIGCLSYLHADEWQRLRGWFGRGNAPSQMKAVRTASPASRIKVESN